MFADTTVTGQNGYSEHVHAIILGMHSQKWKKILTKQYEKNKALYLKLSIKPKFIDIILEFIYTQNLNLEKLQEPIEIIQLLKITIRESITSLFDELSKNIQISLLNIFDLMHAGIEEEKIYLAFSARIIQFLRDNWSLLYTHPDFVNYAYPGLFIYKYLVPLVNMCIEN